MTFNLEDQKSKPEMKKCKEEAQVSNQTPTRHNSYANQERRCKKCEVNELKVGGEIQMSIVLISKESEWWTDQQFGAELQ